MGFQTVIATVYFWTVCCFSVAICACCAPFLNEHDFRAASIRIVSWPLILNPFVTFTKKYAGKIDIDPDRPLMIMANHISWLDLCAIACCLIGEAKHIDLGYVLMLHSSRVMGIPGLGYVCRKLNWIPVEFKSTDPFSTDITAESSAKCRHRCKNALVSGDTLLLFPEGCLYTNGLGKFKPYTFVLACELGVQILPITIEGTQSVSPPSRMHVFHPFLDVTTTVHPVQVPKNAESVDDFIQRVRTRTGGGVPKASRTRAWSK